MESGPQTWGRTFAGHKKAGPSRARLFGKAYFPDQNLYFTEA